MCKLNCVKLHLEGNSILLSTSSISSVDSLYQTCYSPLLIQLTRVVVHLPIVSDRQLFDGKFDLLGQPAL